MNPAQAFREKDRRNIQVIHGREKRNRRHKAPSAPLYEFDEGDQISFDEGTHGVIVIGGLGRGKTASFMLPMASALIEKGLPGFIVDIKNNFTAHVRKLASHAGRESDVVEIGTHSTATPINLLNGLSTSEAQQLIEALILTRQEHSNNVDWLHKGVRLLTDMLILLRYAQQIDERFAPSFVLLDRCINDYEFARNTFALFLQKGYDQDNYTQHSFVQRVRASAAHILAKKGADGHREYFTQLDYQLRAPRQVLSAITSDESLVRNLSNQNATLRLDYRELLKAGKIVVLRFKNTQGHAARLLARSIKERFYSDVYQTLDDAEPPRKCFFMADEYQDVINVSHDNTFDDFSWFSKAREFGCINIVATQALSSLYANHLQRDQVNALVANCSTKIVLQNDDPAADKYFRHFCGLEKTLAQLDSNEALVARFNLKARKQSVNTLTYRNEYEKVRTKLQSIKGQPFEKSKREANSKLMGELDDILFPLTFPETIQARPDQTALIMEFQDIFCAPEDLEFFYDPTQHEEVRKALLELKKRFGTEVTVFGATAIDGAGVFLEVNSQAEERKDVNDFLRELLERHDDTSFI